MPSTELPRSTSFSLDESLVAEARALDTADKLHPFRRQFHLPEHAVYLCGNSLGPMPKRTDAALQTHLHKWKTRAVDGHFEHPHPWISIEEHVSTLSMPIVGARYPHEIAIMNSLTVNIHLFLTAFYKPEGHRNKILIESHAFPSDRHAVTSHVQARGVPLSAVEFLEPRCGEQTLRTDDILNRISELSRAQVLALVLLPGVQFYTGQVFPMKRIAAVCRSHNVPLGLDLAHAVGNIPLQLHDWDVDFAVWCTYKYLNSGPGAIAGAFLHHRWADTPFTRHAGWWGCEKSICFETDVDFRAQKGARGFQLSNPPVLALAPVAASLSVFADAGGIYTLRRKSMQMTDLLLRAMKKKNLGCRVNLVTPENVEERGNQLSLQMLHGVDVDVVHKELDKLGVVCDVRKPDVIRVSPAPLFNSFHDVVFFVEALEHVLSKM